MSDSRFQPDEAASGIVESVHFSFYSDEEVRKISVKAITKDEILDAKDAPVPGGLHDPAMGPINETDSCKTCGQQHLHCPGHYGHIDLARPIYNPLLFRSLKSLLQITCHYCHKFRMGKEKVTSGLMVAFAGRKYAARSLPIFVGNSSYAVTSFTLVLEFKKGTLQNLFWKHDGCASCSGKSNFVCLNKQYCAIKTSDCKGQGQGGTVDCSIGIQLAFSGTDKYYAVLNSWYEVSNLRQYSLFGLYSNLRDSLTSQYDKIF